MEELDFDEISKKADTTSTVEKRKKEFKVKLIITTVLTFAIALIGVFFLNSFVRTTDFSKDVPLSENISRWTPVKWDYPGGPGSVNISLFGKDWTYMEAEQYYESDSCSLRFVNLSGSSGSSDEESTNAYTEEFKKANDSWGGTSNTWVQVTDSDSRIELVRASYSSDSSETINYYRAAPANGTLNMLVLSCSDKGEAEKLLPNNGGKELEGVSLTPTIRDVKF